MFFSDEFTCNRSEEQILALIAEEEQVRNKKYYLLGKAFMDMYPSVREEVLADCIQEILDIDKKICAYQKEIKIINGAVFCENCDSELAENAIFCGVCGYKVSEPVIKISEGHARCTNCGYIYQKGIRYCINCGNELVEKALTKEASKDVEDESCVNCGTKLEKGALFCTECGARQ